MHATGASLADRFDARSNAIGFLRLAFAITVVVSHTWPVGGYGADPGRADNNLGILAVEGFFALSGFLITRSAAMSPSVCRFLWNRCLRIFPGYWASLVVVAVVAAVLYGVPSSGFVTNNLTLHLGQTTIGDTLAGNPFPGLWNGPLYTLAFEFLCYLAVAGLASLRLLRASVVLGCAVLCMLWLQAVAPVPAIDDRQARFTLAFFVGASMYALARRVPAGAVALTVAALLAAGSYLLGAFTIVGIPAFAYAVVVAAAWLPWHRVGVRRDFSYGVYVYAWPVQQLLVVAGVAAFGVPAYLLLTLAVIAPFAAASWYLVESRALLLRSLGSRSRPSAVVGLVDRDPAAAHAGSAGAAVQANA